MRATTWVFKGSQPQSSGDASGGGEGRDGWHLATHRADMQCSHRELPRLMPREIFMMTCVSEQNAAVGQGGLGLGLMTMTTYICERKIVLEGAAAASASTESAQVKT